MPIIDPFDTNDSAIVDPNDAPATTGQELRQGEKPSIWQQIGRAFKDPEKDGARAVQALVDSESLGISPSQAFRYRDQIDQGIKINPKAASLRSSFSERVKQSFDTGVKQNKIGEIGYKFVMTGDPKYLSEIDAEKIPGEEETFIPESRLESAIRSAAKMLPMMGDNLLEGSDKGLKLGMAFGGAAAILGQAGPQVALPEEVITVPTATLLGFKIGATEGAFEAALRKESGLALSEIIKFQDAEGNRIDPNIARAASFGIGSINAAIEIAQINTLLKTIPGADKLFSNAIMEVVTNKTVKQKLMALAGKYSTTVATETGQEVAQESTNIIFEELAKRLNNNLKDTDIKPAAVETILARLKETAVEAAQGFAVLSLPGTVVSAGASARKPAAAITQPVAAPVIEPGQPVPEAVAPVTASAQESPAISTDPAEQETLPPIDEAEQDDAIDTIFSGAQNSDDLTIFDEVEEDEETKPASIIDSLKAINTSLGEKGSVDLAPIVEIGKSVWDEGATTIEAFTTRVKEIVGDAWENVKDLVAQAWEAVKSFNEKLGERGSFSTEDISRSSKQDKTAKKRIREETGQVKSEEVKDLNAAFKKAERYSRIAFKEGVAAGVEKANAPKKETVKGRIRRLTGQVSIADMVREDEALKAAFKKAEQAGRIAWREGNKEGVAEQKAIFKALIAKAREQFKTKTALAKDVKSVKKLAQMKGEISVDYQKQIRELTADIDFTKPTEETKKKLQGLAEFIEREGIPIGISKKHLDALKRLSKKAVKDMTPAEVKELKDKLKLLTALGKLKQELKYKYKRRERAKKLKRVKETTNNLDPHVLHGENRFRDKVKVAGTVFYLDTLHTPRVAEMADNFTDGPQKEFIQEIGEAETTAISSAISREVGLLEKIKAAGVDIIEEGSESDIRMSVVMRYREGALSQAETLMEHYGLNELPVLTPQEEAVIELIRQDMEDNKADLAAVFEEVENEIFPEQEVYYLPLKYEKEEEIVPDTQVEGRGRTTHTFDGFTNKRRPGVKKIPRVGVLQIYKEAVLEQEWYKHLQPVMEDVKSIVLTDEYKASAGEVLYNWWKDEIDIVSRRGWSASAHLSAGSALLRTVRHNLNTAILAFKASTIMLQPFAVFDAMAYVNAKIGTGAAGRVLAEVTKSFLAPGYTKSIIAESQALQQRQGGELAITEELLKAQGEGLKDKLTRIGFKWISTADLKTAAGVQEAVRKIFIEEGMSPQEALKEAEMVMHLSQGSSAIAYRPHILAKGEGARTWFTFQTFVMNRWGIIAHDLIAGKIKHGEAKEKLVGLVSLAILMMAGAAEDDAREWLYELTSGKKMKEDKRSLPEKTFVNLAGTMPFFGSFINAASSGMDASPPTIRTLQKGIKGTDNMFTGKNAEKRFNGLMNATESGLIIGVGFPGTAQFFDLLENALTTEKKGR